MSQEHLGKFIEIRKRLKKEATLSPFIESSLLSLMSSERDELFQLALLVWNASFDPNTLKNLIADASQENDSERKAIKLVRKQGIILASAYTYLDQRQTAPAHHNYLMKKIGKLNDPILIMAFLKAKNKAITATSKYNSVVTLDYKPESDHQYQAHIVDTLQNLRDIFQKQILLIPEFHSARKELRKLMNLLQIRAVLHDDEASYAEVSNWFMLNTKLGEINDTALLNASGDKKLYKSTTVNINPLLLSQVLEQLK